MDTPTVARLDAQDPGGARTATVLIYAVDHERRAELTDTVDAAGWVPLAVASPAAAIDIVDDVPPDLFLLALEGVSGDELELLDRVRDHPDGDRVPVICLIERKHRRVTIDAFRRRADDVVSGRPHRSELIARMQARVERPPVPRTDLVYDPVTGALTGGAFVEQLTKERERLQRRGTPGALAFLALDELPGLTELHGTRARDELLAQVVRLIQADGRRLDHVGIRRGVVGLLLPDTPRRGAQIRLERLARLIDTIRSRKAAWVLGASPE